MKGSSRGFGEIRKKVGEWSSRGREKIISVYSEKREKGLNWMTRRKSPTLRYRRKIRPKEEGWEGLEKSN